MQSSNLLSLPFRRSSYVSLSEAIINYVQERYNQHISAFSDDLEAIDRLRKDAVNSLEPHQSGVIKLQRYAAQLVFLCSKFPLDVSKPAVTLNIFRS